MSRCLLSVVSVGVVVGLSASASLADAQGTLEVRRIGNGLGRQITISGSAFPIDSPLTVHVGELTHEFRNGTGIAAGISGVMNTFCIDLTQDSSAGWETFDVRPVSEAPVPVGPMGNVKAAAIASVFAGANGSQHSDADHAAAFAMLMWEIVADYNATPASISLTDGTARFDSDLQGFDTVQTIFNTYAGFIDTVAPSQDVRGVTHSDFQDQLVPIPAPGSVGLAGAALALIGARRRRA